MKCEKKWIGSLLILCCVVFASTCVQAYVSEGPCVDITNSNLKASAFLNSSEIDYKFEIENHDDADIEVERKIIGMSLTKAIDKKMDMYGAIGYLFDGSLKPEDSNDYDLDSGYFLSAGARYMMVQSQMKNHLFQGLEKLQNIYTRIS